MFKWCDVQDQIYTPSAYFLQATRPASDFRKVTLGPQIEILSNFHRLCQVVLVFLTFKLKWSKNTHQLHRGFESHLGPPESNLRLNPKKRLLRKNVKVMPHLKNLPFYAKFDLRFRSPGDDSKSKCDILVDVKSHPSKNVINFL